MMGIPLKTIFLYWMGNEMGSRAPEGINVMPVSIPVGTQPLHAVGVAWAAKLKGDKIVTLTYFGDGATSKGDFHEAMNFAGVFKTPTIFFCQNNQFAISVPRTMQTASQRLPRRPLPMDSMAFRWMETISLPSWLQRKKQWKRPVPEEGPHSSKG